MKTVFIGSVEQSRVALETLLDLDVQMDLVCSLNESAAQNVCDYAPLHDIAKARNVPFAKFEKVSELTETIEKIAPDFLFVIGISQIIPKKIIDSAKYTIGFHPTPLPRYRGRAPIPWMILLHEQNPMISLFILDEGMDSGDIIHREPYKIAPDDHATEVYQSVCTALKEGLIKCVPSLYNGTAKFTPQDHSKASFILIRRPEDGKIDWSQSGEEIYDLIRAAAPPYPGAFSSYNGEKVIFQRAALEKNTNVTGIPGQIYKIEDGRIYVLTKDGYFIILHEYTPVMKFIVGKKFI